MKNIFCVLIFFALLPASAWSEQTTSLSWAPETIENGSVCLFLVQSPHATFVSGRWQGHALDFFQAQGERNSWYALAGVDVGTKPGDYEIVIEFTSAGHEAQTLHSVVHVKPNTYQEIPLSVPEKFVEPSAKELKSIARDRKIKDKIFSHSASIPLWKTDFEPPLPRAPSTDSFGTRRIFNGTLASVHRGLDYHARTGTPVMAVNNGRVLLAQPLYYEGNCIVIDHGLGLTTIYMHLSKFRVKEGQPVKRGQVIALSGRTGRATGPHLHLSVRWRGEYLDPVKLFSLKLPTPAHRQKSRSSAVEARDRRSSPAPDQDERSFSVASESPSTKLVQQER